MGEENVYEDLLYLSVFLGGLWAAGYLCQLVKISPIVGQVLFGILLGPNGLAFVPLFNGEEFLEELLSEEECQALFNESGEANESTVVRLARAAEEEEEKNITEIENYLVILGQLGVTLLILESGLHVDFKTLRKVGASAFLVAVIGTFMPIILGIGFAEILGFGAYPEGLAIGAVLAPTSVGIALKLLHEAHVLDSTFGQTIVTAAFTDDIFSLVALAVLLELAAGELTALSVLAPLLSCASFILCAFMIAIYVIPKIVPPVLNKIAQKYGQGHRDIAHLGLMFLTLALYGFIGDLIGSHLLGAFLSGITFAKVPRTHHVWSHEMDVINTWLLAVFFGATVAFAVPVDELLSVDAFLKGLAVAAVPCILGKVVSGLALKKRWVVGWAMVGRGEFAFLVAQTLKETEFQDTEEPFLSDEGFGVSVWALLIATLVAPIAFGFVLASQLKREQAAEDDKGNLIEQKFSTHAIHAKSSVARMTNLIFSDQKKQAPRSEWMITIGTRYQQNLARDIMSIFAANDIHVVSLLNEGTMETSLMTFVLLVPDSSQESRALSGIQMRPSVADMRRQSRAMQGVLQEAPTYKDDYFAFDIDIFIERLKDRILTTINAEAEVQIKRHNVTGAFPVPGEDREKNKLFSTVYESELQADDDADSAEGDGRKSRDADEDEI